MKISKSRIILVMILVIQSLQNPHLIDLPGQETPAEFSSPSNRDEELKVMDAIGKLSDYESYAHVTDMNPSDPELKVKLTD